MESVRRARRTCIIVGIAASTILGVNGCASSGADGIELPSKNAAQWVTPLDNYIPKNLVAGSYAETLLDGLCMRTAGFANWAVPWRETKPDDGPSWNSVGTRLFNTDLASQFGYHPAPAVRSDRNPAWDDFTRRVNGSVSASEDAAFVACRDKVRKENPLIAPEAGILNLALGYLSQATEVAKKERSVLDAAAKWRDCMKPQGISDLPESPQEMPPPSLRSNFRLDAGADADELDQAAGASADEINLAVADARCQEKSGFQKHLYDAVWEETARIYEENFDALERAKVKIKKQDEAAQKVINEYTPLRPN